MLRKDSNITIIWRLVCFGAIICMAIIARGNDGDTRRAVPDEADQKEGKSLVGEIFRDEYKTAATADARVALAKKMIEMAQQTNDDPVGRYVLTRVALDICVKAKDVALTLNAIDSLDREYRVDGLKLKVDALSKIVQLRPARDRENMIFYRLGPLHALALENDKYKLADKIAGLEMTIASRHRDKKKRERALAHQKAVSDLLELYGNVDQSLEELKEDPRDPEANLAVGSFRCFGRGDWQAGLPLLALGSDEDLSKVAKLDLAGAESNADKAKIADAWWNLADERKTSEQAAMKHRAAYWYREGMYEGMPVIAKLKARKRLEEVAKLPPMPRRVASSRPSTPAVPRGSDVTSPPPSTVAKPDPVERPSRPTSPPPTTVAKPDPVVERPSRPTAPVTPRPGSPLVPYKAPSKAELNAQLRFFINNIRKAKPVNLGSGVNSRADEGKAAISPDGCELVFGCFGNARSTRHTDLWTSTRASRGEQFGPAVSLPGSVNSHKYEADPALSGDGRFMLFVSDRGGGSGGWDLWMCQRPKRGQPFGDPANMGPAINSNVEDYCPALSADGKTLVFISCRSGGVGEADLWMSTRTSTRKPFGSPVNMGSPINSGNDEEDPALAIGGRLLVFASANRPGGHGGKDLWMCARASSDAPWDEPVNLGPNINTRADEGGVALSADGQLLIFTGRHPGGHGGSDLWMVDLGEM